MSNKIIWSFFLGFVSSVAIAFLCAYLLSVFILTARNKTYEQVKMNEPTQIFDIKGRLITEFFSDEKRKLIDRKEIPSVMIQALLAREDNRFFYHNGFDFRSILRAIFNILWGKPLQGASTLTQQLAGNQYANRRDISVSRKIIELWWSFQLERALSKEEILTRYLNLMPFGHTNYGIEAASLFYFQKKAKHISPAEATLLAIQLVNPAGLYSPFKNPKNAKKMQKNILDQMVNLEYLSKEEARISLSKYWNEDYDWQKDSVNNAFFSRRDRAPYFSEYIRTLIPEYIFGAIDFYKDGLRIYTTLDLDAQALAEKYLVEGIQNVNASIDKNTRTQTNILQTELLPLMDLFGLSFNIEALKIEKKARRAEAIKKFQKELFDLSELLSLGFNIRSWYHANQSAYAKVKLFNAQNTVEGALITLNQSNGYITALVGGSEFNQKNQFNRALYAQKQPGSIFKPLYYAAALDAQLITPASIFNDAPIVFINADGSPYEPQDYLGVWRGNVSVRQSLAHSLNIPSLLILKKVGFQRAIKVSSGLLGFDDPSIINQKFPKVYPFGLGVISIKPIQMAQAFATIANLGRRVEPLAIRYIEDRNGTILAYPEQDYLKQRRENPKQIISPQSAYILIDLLKSTVKVGTLFRRRLLVKGFDSMPMAGKTGTTQNWGDAWTSGFSPYYTTTIWLGFDQGNKSLGTKNTGATTAGLIWAKYMKALHKDLSPKDFYRPEGIVKARVNKKTGLKAKFKDPNTIEEVFIEGTVPWGSNIVASRISPDLSLSSQEKIYFNLLNNYIFLGKQDKQSIQEADYSLLN